MDVEQVYVVQLHPLQHVVDSLHRLALAILGGPELAGNPDVLARYAALLHGTPHAPLVVVGVGGVDVSVAGLQGSEARLLAHLVGGLQEGAQSEARHLHAVVQRHHGHARSSGFLLCAKGAQAAAQKQCGQQKCSECVHNDCFLLGSLMLQRYTCPAPPSIHGLRIDAPILLGSPHETCGNGVPPLAPTGKGLRPRRRRSATRRTKVCAQGSKGALPWATQGAAAVSPGGPFGRHGAKNSPWTLAVSPKLTTFAVP